MQLTRKYASLDDVKSVYVQQRPGRYELIERGGNTRAYAVIKLVINGKCCKVCFTACTFGVAAPCLSLVTCMNGPDVMRAELRATRKH